MTGVEVEVSRVAAETDITSMLSRIEGPNPSWGQHDDILSLTTVATRLAGVEVPQGTESGLRAVGSAPICAALCNARQSIRAGCFQRGLADTLQLSSACWERACHLCDSRRTTECRSGNEMARAPGYLASWTVARCPCCISRSVRARVHVARSFLSARRARNNDASECGDCRNNSAGIDCTFEARCDAEGDQVA